MAALSSISLDILARGTNGDLHEIGTVDVPIKLTLHTSTPQTGTEVVVDVQPDADAVQEELIRQFRTAARRAPGTYVSDKGIEQVGADGSTRIRVGDFGADPEDAELGRDSSGDWAGSVVAKVLSAHAPHPERVLTQEEKAEQEKLREEFEREQLVPDYAADTRLVDLVAHIRYAEARMRSRQDEPAFWDKKWHDQSEPVRNSWRAETRRQIKELTGHGGE